MKSSSQHNRQTPQGDLHSNWLPLNLQVMLQEGPIGWNHGFREEACVLNPDLTVNPYSTVPPKVEPEPEPEPVGPQRMDVPRLPVTDAMTVEH